VGSRSDLSFDEYVSARWVLLVRSAVLLGADPHAAEDAVQTALARCYFAWGRVAATRDPDAYVHRVLINTLRASWRRRWTGERPHADLPVSEAADHTERVDAEQTMLTALRALPDHQRQVLVLRYYADLTEAQTAEALGIAVGTVKSRAARALAHLAIDPRLDGLAAEPHE
jgi:RNA polymerase sigma-70 factor (sigma-E family)